jgi:hypothetical protein
LEKTVYSFHDLRAAVSFCTLQDTNERAPVGRGGIDVMSVLDTFFHRGDVAGRVRDRGAKAFVVVCRVHLKHSGNLELPSDWLYPDTADDTLSFRKGFA